jgi:hypothetical protein
MTINQQEMDMNCHIIATLFVAVVLATAPMTAQTTSSQTTETRTVRAPDVVTIEGCLQPEAKIAGREPSALEKAGILEDYILVNTKVVKGRVPNSGASSSMDLVRYKVIGISDDQLKKHVGKRIQVEGKMARLEQGTRIASDPIGIGENLPQIDGSVIRQVQGTCPAR